jgi:hypothetical protein
MSQQALGLLVTCIGIVIALGAILILWLGDNK